MVGNHTVTSWIGRGDVARVRYERSRAGIDFTILYPTNTLLTPAEEDQDLRRGLCAGFNAFYADVYGPFADRMTTAGIVPMHTPEEAIAELHHMHELGIKVACFPEGVLRPLAQPAGDSPSPWLFAGQRQWFDCFALDSLYDYDPVWQTCRARVAVNFTVPQRAARIHGRFEHAANTSPVMRDVYAVKAIIMGGSRDVPRSPFVLWNAASRGVQWLATQSSIGRRNIEALGGTTGASRKQQPRA